MMSMTKEIPDREPKTVEEWVKFVREDFIGLKVPGSDYPFINYGVTARDFREFALAHGDDNPLYTDPVYAVKTRWAGPIAPPTFPMWFRYSGGTEAVYAKGIQVTHMNGGIEIYQYDVIRPGDRFRTEKKFSDVVLKGGGRVGGLPISYDLICVWNQCDQIIAKEIGWSLRPQKAIAGGADISRPRDIYKYTEAEKAKIIKDMESYPPRRGAKPRYWEDVNVGEELPIKVTGPMTYADFAVTFCGFSYYPDIGRPFGLGYLDSFHSGHAWTAEELPLHSVANFRFPLILEHSDPFLCKGRGIPLPFDYGVARSALAYLYVVDWMGDDGWVFRLKTAMREVFLIGDCIWLTGKVVKKEKTAEGAAVNISFAFANQFGAIVTTVDATVLLPSRIDGPVRLPIPQPTTPIPHETLTPMEL